MPNLASSWFGALRHPRHSDYYRSHSYDSFVPMKFVTVRDLRGKTSELWQTLERERELVVTSNGKPIAILSATDEDTFEQCVWALRRSRARDALEHLQRDADARGLATSTQTEIDTEIAKSRRRRAG